MREWLSGGAPPCQGGGRGFDPRLALWKMRYPKRISHFLFSLNGGEPAQAGATRESYEPYKNKQNITRQFFKSGE